MCELTLDQESTHAENADVHFYLESEFVFPILPFISLKVIEEILRGFNEASYCYFSVMNLGFSK